MKKDPAPVGIGAMWNLIMWNRCSSGLVSVVQVKNPITGWHRNNQNTSSLSRSAFSFPLTPSHYSLPHSLIHLSEVFQVAASYLSLTLLSGFISVDILITGLISNPFQIPPSLSTSLFLPSPLLLSCSLAPSTTSSLLSMISSFLPLLRLRLACFFCFSSH